MSLKFLVNLRIGPKLIAAFMVVGLLPFMVVGFLAVQESSDGLTQQAFNQLVSVRAIKKAQIDRFFVERQGDMAVLVDTVMTLTEEAETKMNVARESTRAQIQDYFARLSTDAAALGKSKFVLDAYGALVDYDNTPGLGPKNPLTDPYDVTTPEYKTIHKEHGVYISAFAHSYGYDEVFLICKAHGHVMFASADGIDRGANLGKGDLSSSPLGTVWRKVVETEKVQFADFEPYAARDNAYAGFVGAPVRDQSGKVLGVVAMRVPHAPMETIINRREGLGATGDTYVAGKWPDGTNGLRTSVPTMTAKNPALKLGFRASTPYIELALAGETGYEIFTDSTGKLSIASYAPLDVAGVNWAAIAKMDLQEAIAPKLEGESKDFFTKYIEKYGYYDLFLIHPDGNVFYSVTKEADYGTNMVSGKYADSGLGKLVRKVIKTKTFAIADFAPYAASNDEPAAFIAQPILHGDDVELVVALQLSLESINAIMGQRDGLGETGETYLVGPDKLMRSDSFLDPVNHSVKGSFANPSKGLVDTAAVRAALGGETGAEIITDYNGNLVLSAYTPVPMGDVVWGLLAEIDKAEAFRTIDALQQEMFVIAGIGVILIGLAGFFAARSISGPITSMTGAMRSLADGDLSADIPAAGRADEIGDMSGAVQVFKDNAVEMRRMEQQREADARRNQRKVQSELRALNNAMEEEVKHAVGSVLEKSVAMQTSAQGMAATAEQTSQRATAVAAASEQASANVQTVAAAAEELASSVTEISRQVTQSSQIAGTAVLEADRTNQQVQGLAETVNGIGQVVSLINDIADQTNLLALNATIEAARAGEAGKGFAVVASEVKNLANQTAKATGQISDQIDGVQKATAEAVTAIGSIGGTIGEINEIASAIAAAVEEQGAATQEIARNVEQAAAGTREVSENISGVTQAAGDTGQAASVQLTAASEVDDLVKQMQNRLTKLTEDSANPHLSERHTVNMAIKITVAETTGNGLMHEISRAGAAVLGRIEGLEEGIDFEIDIPGLKRLTGAAIAVTEDSTHVRFDLSDDETKAVDAFVTTSIEKRAHTKSA